MNKTNTKRTLLALLAGIAFIVAAATLTACTAAPLQSVDTDGSNVEAPQEIQRATIEESKVAFDSGKAVFVDVRSEDSYAVGHIPGALSIPLAELEAHIGELDSSQWIITYCT